MPLKATFPHYACTLLSRRITEMFKHVHCTEGLFSFMHGSLISVMLESTLQGSQNMSRKMLRNITLEIISST
jgi:hypothetical protein